MLCCCCFSSFNKEMLAFLFINFSVFPSPLSLLLLFLCKFIDLYECQVCRFTLSMKTESLSHENWAFFSQHRGTSSFLIAHKATVFLIVHGPHVTHRRSEKLVNNLVDLEEKKLLVLRKRLVNGLHGFIHRFFIVVVGVALHTSLDHDLHQL